MPDNSSKWTKTFQDKVRLIFLLHIQRLCYEVSISPTRLMIHKLYWALKWARLLGLILLLGNDDNIYRPCKLWWIQLPLSEKVPSWYTVSTQPGEKKKKFLFLTNTHLFASLVVSKTFLFVKEMTLPTSAINIWVIFSVFYAFVLGNRDSTNQPVSYRLRGIISGVTHQKRVFLENCITCDVKQITKRSMSSISQTLTSLFLSTQCSLPMQKMVFHAKNVKHMLLFTDKYPFSMQSRNHLRHCSKFSFETLLSWFEIYSRLFCIQSFGDQIHLILWHA